MAYLSFCFTLQVVRWKPEWAVLHRLLLKRLLMSQKQRDEHLGGRHNDFSSCHYEWFVKWNGLGYEHATWELESEPFLRSPEAMNLIRDYETRRKKAKIATVPTREDKVALNLLMQKLFFLESFSLLLLFSIIFWSQFWDQGYSICMT